LHQLESKTHRELKRIQQLLIADTPAIGAVAGVAALEVARACSPFSFEGARPLTWPSGRKISISCDNQVFKVFSSEGPPQLQSGTGLTLSECDVRLFADVYAAGFQPDPQDVSGGLRQLVFPGSGGSEVKFVQGLLQLPHQVCVRPPVAVASFVSDVPPLPSLPGLRVFCCAFSLLVTRRGVM
jgi:hypothetical protein